MRSGNKISDGLSPICESVNDSVRYPIEKNPDLLSIVSLSTVTKKEHAYASRSLSRKIKIIYNCPCVLVSI